MKPKTLRIRLALGLLAVSLAGLGGVVYAQATGYDLPWWTMDGGGGASTGAGYTLSGTVGQPEAGTLSGGGYALAGGFWGGAATVTEYNVYLPAIVR